MEGEEEVTGATTPGTTAAATSLTAYDDEEMVMGASSGGGEDELSLPKATVYKLITEMLPTGIVCPRDTRDLLIGCCVEFIHLLSSEANEVCERAARKTISPEHVLEALNKLGFGSYVEEVRDAYEEAQTAAKEKERQRGSSKLEKSGLTEEELLKQQEELFQQARLKYIQQRQQQQPHQGQQQHQGSWQGGEGEYDRARKEDDELELEEEAGERDGDDTGK